MATYEYRCPVHGPFQVRTPIGEAEPSAGCGVCGAAAARVFSAPMLAFTPPALAAALDRAGRSAESPQVVSRIPDRRPAHRH